MNFQPIGGPQHVESGKGRNSKRPSELGEGRCKNKAAKGHKRKWGEVGPEKAQVPLEENALETISSLSVCERVTLLAYKMYDLVMGLRGGGGGGLACCFNKPSEP